ncbi:hypothetical protein CBL_10815 [Carabus blaptoides fortunei]
MQAPAVYEGRVIKLAKITEDATDISCKQQQQMATNTYARTPQTVRPPLSLCYAIRYGRKSYYPLGKLRRNKFMDSVLCAWLGLFPIHWLIETRINKTDVRIRSVWRGLVWSDEPLHHAVRTSFREEEETIENRHVPVAVNVGTPVHGLLAGTGDSNTGHVTLITQIFTHSAWHSSIAGREW